VGGSVLRAAAFLAGLLGLRAAELLGPHHAPTAPLARRWLANLGFGLANGILVSALFAAAFALSPLSLVPRPGAALPRVLPSGWAQIVAAVVLLDLVTYALHRAYHRIPVLWRFHAVHHTDLDLDVSSASRFHPGEVLLSAVVKTGVVVLVGIPAAGLVTFEVMFLAAAQFQHANVRIPARLEPFLWATLVPPAMHRIHHAPERRDTDSNYGTILTLWDRLFGSFNRREPDEAPAFGIPGMRDPERLGLFLLAFLPFRRPAGT
jgi:sterol desaturase/sphingolipid hydroxylase (fatty acid hydroxylase superfamily)